MRGLAILTQYITGFDERPNRQARRLRYFGHLVRMDQHRLPNIGQLTSVSAFEDTVLLNALRVYRSVPDVTLPFFCNFMHTEVLRLNSTN